MLSLGHLFSSLPAFFLSPGQREQGVRAKEHEELSQFTQSTGHRRTQPECGHGELQK